MITRVTQQTMHYGVQRSLQTNLARLAELQDKASSQRAITRPSDDPAAAAEAIRIRADLRANEQYGRNISNGEGWLTELDNAMTTSKRALDRVNELTLQGSNSSLPPAARETLALEVQALRGELGAQANASYAGRFLFAGNADTPAALTPELTFVGGGTVERRIGPGETVRVDADGASVFGSGPTSAFALLDRIAADLRAGKDVSVHLAPLQQRIRDVTAEHSTIGTRHARLLSAKDGIADAALALEGRRAAVEDVELASVILDLRMQETAYQGALAVSARVLQPSLLDFLR
ncbi:flagellar hook-associated protein 3 [Arthrobacter echini]|uniref:Flagellar hook-associated protein 3 n=1 Tax=Arthrobacter echini TaxID=1529066 RepID=A0A4S5E179_9MICC|nr:flagellar hook-associated protein FlgL [Arthrobacter echini]THJ65060.1 flagellar hook-associated protein 3 [Arthrobacter echini]